MESISKEYDAVEEKGQESQLLVGSDAPKLPIDDATASSSEFDETDSLNDNVMPLFKYARINGAVSRIPRRVPSTGLATPLSSRCSCTQLGRIHLTRKEDGTIEGASDLAQQPVLLAGHTNGLVAFVLVESGAAILDSKQLQVNPTGEQAAIVDVSLDASSNYLAAINVGGCCAIWELRYGAPADVPTQEPEHDNVFKSFLTNLAGQSGANNNNQTDPSSHLNTTIVHVSRITYPSSFGTPIRLVLDPGYKKRREKSMLVAFSDGRLVLTKRGFVFQRRNDAVLYQATSGDCVEAISWRGALVAWADASGIKIFDTETMTRIAHIDRPVGARASLYATISDLKPCLCFETSNQLLVAWGDCVMTMTIKETIVRQQLDTSGTSTMANGSAQHASELSSSNSTVVKRRQVECSMAWELDCVACGVAPLDRDHLIILGLVPNDDREREAIVGPNDVEVQVISRSLGTVIYVDVLPILRFPSQYNSTPGGPIHESASVYNMVSSFAIPRMEDAAEAEEEGIAPDTDFDFTLFASNSNKSTFVDAHLRWSLDSMDFDGSCNDDADKFSSGSKSDDDSDDYEFILQSSSNLVRRTAMIREGTVPPVLVVGTPADLVMISTRDVDDAISHALSLGKVGLALHRALRHKRMVRKHDMDGLVDSFLRRVLCIAEAGKTQPEQKLSIHRLEIAAQSTPVLLGGNPLRWEYWVDEFSRIPGALFLLCCHLPVRDPKLRPTLYEGVLKCLLREIEQMLEPVDGDGALVSAGVIDEAVNRFIGVLRAWGPTHALREIIRFNEHLLEKKQMKLGNTDVAPTTLLTELELVLTRRITQSAAGYLELPSETPIRSRTIINGIVTGTSGATVEADSSLDSLFQLNDMLSIVSSRVPIFHKDNRKEKYVDDLSNNQLPSKAALLAMAELNHMKMNYDAALHCYLVIGSLYSPERLATVEKRAAQLVSHGVAINKCDALPSYDAYGFVLSMVEHHHLHGSLLDANLLEADKDDKRISPPLISLVRLLGLEVAGDFLIDHCVPPPGRTKFDSSASGASSINSADSDVSKATMDGYETLPINYVADQLRASPSLLHWYLHLIFTRRPEMYVHFPNTAVPPRAVTELHRTHLELYVDFAEDKDSALSLVGTQVYNQERKTTPLLQFLKAALPLGGLRPNEVRKFLERRRSDCQEDVAEFPTSFALELAHVIENYGDASEKDSHQVLDLYLRGSKSIMLAAAYAERNHAFGTILWGRLIEYCMAGGEPMLSEGDVGKVDGTMFGSLLEAAALCGADLALLVTSIPEGMDIEGLKPRLVAAVADYRMKLSMNKAALDGYRNDRIGLLRELGHRSRRGLRQFHIPSSLTLLTPEISETRESGDQPRVSLRRPVERPSRYRLSVRLPMR